MVEAGEASGGLAEILSKVAGYFESTVKLTKKVKSAMTYPIAVIGLSFALVNRAADFRDPGFRRDVRRLRREAAGADAIPDHVSNFLKPDFSSITQFFLKISIIHLGVAGYGLWLLLMKFIATPNGRRRRMNSSSRPPSSAA